MLSIEEAFEVLSEACWWNIRVSGRVQSTTTEREFVGIEKAAARALALAVLEKEHDGSSDLSCRCMTWSKGVRCRSYGEARARIKALGL